MPRFRRGGIRYFPMGGARLPGALALTALRACTRRRSKRARRSRSTSASCSSDARCSQYSTPEFPVRSRRGETGTEPSRHASVQQRLRDGGQVTDFALLGPSLCHSDQTVVRNRAQPVPHADFGAKGDLSAVAGGRRHDSAVRSVSASGRIRSSMSCSARLPSSESLAVTAARSWASPSSSDRSRSAPAGVSRSWRPAAAPVSPAVEPQVLPRWIL